MLTGARLTAVTALFSQNESGGGPGTGRNAAYLAHALHAGTPGRYTDIMARVLTGLLALA